MEAYLRSRWIVLGALAPLILVASTARAQYGTQQAQALIADIQAVNRCRVVEAQKIDDGRMSVELVAQKIQPLCQHELNDMKRDLVGTPMASQAGHLDDLNGIALAVKQERSPNEAILSPR